MLNEVIVDYLNDKSNVTDNTSSKAKIIQQPKDCITIGDPEGVIATVSLKNLGTEIDPNTTLFTIIGDVEVTVTTNIESVSSNANGEFIVTVIMKPITEGNFKLSIIPKDLEGNTITTITSNWITAVAPVIIDKGYIGHQETIELDPGKYKLEAWGAQGGSDSNYYHGGYGGYSTGIINLTEKTTLYINVGGSGSYAYGENKSGGYNGGGAATSEGRSIGTGSRRWSNFYFKDIRSFI